MFNVFNSLSNIQETINTLTNSGTQINSREKSILAHLYDCTSTIIGLSKSFDGFYCDIDHKSPILYKDKISTNSFLEKIKKRQLSLSPNSR